MRYSIERIAMSADLGFASDLEACKRALKKAETALSLGDFKVAKGFIEDALRHGREVEIWCQFEINKAKPVQT
jgi:hypothetical protein